MVLLGPNLLQLYQHQLIQGKCRLKSQCCRQAEMIALFHEIKGYSKQSILEEKTVLGSSGSRRDDPSLMVFA